MKPPLRAVIFDYGNTLVRIDPALHSTRTDYADVVAVPGAERMTRHLERRGLVPRDRGLGFIDRFLAIREANRARAEASGDEIPAGVSLREAFRDQGLAEPAEGEIRDALVEFFRVEEDLLEKIPGADRTIAQLRERGLATAALSNATDGAYVRRMITRFGWEGAFDPVVVSTDIGVRKPRAEAFRAVLDGWTYRPEEVAIVGDSLRHDVGGGAPLGLRTVHFALIPNPFDPPYEGRVIPDAAFTTHEELLRYLLQAATPD